MFDIFETFQQTPPFLIHTKFLMLVIIHKNIIVVVKLICLHISSSIHVIRVVGEHTQGKITLSPLVLNETVDVKFSDLFRVLKQRQSAMKLKPQDLNSATHLIRSALGGTAYGVDHGRLSQMLTLPPDMVRMFRDDITVTVIFFDQEFLRHC